MIRLRRYWFTFEGPAPLAFALSLGCGVTAFTLDDALFLLGQAFELEKLPPVVSVVEDVDVSTLDAGHVLPNTGPPVWRGVWFPRGFSLLR